MKRQLLALVLALGLGLGCSSSGYGPSSPPPAPPPAPPPPPPAPNTVNVISNEFVPNDMTVARNTTVTWNFLAGPHTVTFEDGLNSSAQQSTGSHQRSFGTAGTFKYRCTIHSNNFASGMIGQIVVTN